MSEQGYEQLTLFPGDSHASHFPWQESKKVKGTTVTYGRKCSELSPKLSRLGYLVKTYLESCPLPGERFVRTWSVRDTLSPYLILKLRLSVQGTGGKECSLWPTATTRDWKDGTAKSCQNVPVNCLLGRAVHMWPTPREFMYKDSTTDRNKGNLGEVVGGQLNPDWVEWLMGLPTGWTDIGE